MKPKPLHILILTILFAGILYIVWYRPVTSSTTSPSTATSTVVDLTASPTATLPSNYSASLVDWFVFGQNKLYGFTDQEVQDKVPEGQVKILDLAGGSSSYIGVTLTSTLTTQDWYILEDEIARVLVSDGTKPMVLTLSTADKSWAIDISPYQPFANMLHIWNVIPDYRYKSDAYPLAFWLMYNIANADGFTQVLTLFKTGPDDTLQGVKTFVGRNGFTYIDLDNDTISIGESATVDPQNGFLGHEKTHVTTYSASTFKQISEKTIPNVYWSDTWLKWNY